MMLLHPYQYHFVPKITKHLFNINEEKFFDIILSVQIFNESVTNDTNGSFFKELSYLMQKYEEKSREENNIAKNNLDKFIKIIDLIINYIQKE